MRKNREPPPAAKARGDVALCLVLAAAYLAQGRVGEAVVIVDAAAQRRLEGHLLGGMLLGFGKGAPEGAEGLSVGREAGRR